MARNFRVGHAGKRALLGKLTLKGNGNGYLRAGQEPGLVAIRASTG